MSQTLLEQGIGAAQSGRRDEARALLTQVVEADERNEQAWLWLAGLVTDPHDMRTCLENVLDLNPGNTKAREGLVWVEQHYGASTAGPPADRPAPAVPVPPVQPPATPAPAPAQPFVLPATAAPELACPYCGAATQPDNTRCPACRASLMAPVAARGERSKALSTLGWLWNIGGILNLLGTIFSMYVIFQLGQKRGFAGLHLADLNQPGLRMADIQLRMIGGFVYGACELAIGIGLLQRRRWAWIVSAGLTALMFIASLGMALFFTVIMRTLLTSISRGATPQGSPIGTVFLLIIMLIVFAPQLLSMILTFFSYTDVFVPMERIQPSVTARQPFEHFNRGVDYKEHGMWYMAAQEWHAAVEQAPGEPRFVYALGLAYTQLKQYGPARATLDRAIELAPDDAQIRESRAVIDRLDKPGKTR